MNTERLKEALYMLTNLPVNYCGRDGLCTTCLKHVPSSFTNEMFKCWKHFSGDLGYPVPDQNYPHYSAKMAFNRCENLYSRRTYYGLMRWRLVAHCIKYIEDALKRDKQNDYLYE